MNLWVGVALFPLAVLLIIGGIAGCVRGADLLGESDLVEVAVRSLRFRAMALIAASFILAVAGLLTMEISLAIWMPYLALV